VRCFSVEVIRSPCRLEAFIDIYSSILLDKVRTLGYSPLLQASSSVSNGSISVSTGFTGFTGF